MPATAVTILLLFQDGGRLLNINTIYYSLAHFPVKIKQKQKRYRRTDIQKLREGFTGV